MRVRRRAPPAHADGLAPSPAAQQRSRAQQARAPAPPRASPTCSSPTRAAVARAGLCSAAAGSISSYVFANQLKAKDVLQPAMTNSLDFLAPADSVVPKGALCAHLDESTGVSTTLRTPDPDPDPDPDPNPNRDPNPSPNLNPGHHDPQPAVARVRRLLGPVQEVGLLLLRHGREERRHRLHAPLNLTPCRCAVWLCAPACALCLCAVVPGFSGWWVV